MNRPTETIPTELTRLESELKITWSDRSVSNLSYRELRKACPCARCITEEDDDSEQNANPLAVLPIEKTQPIKIAGMQPVGNYAYNVEFSDGHNTGLFTLDLLWNLTKRTDQDASGR